MHDALEYYKTLQISQDADNESIKQSYRDLAKKWHPDYNREQSSTDIFQQISVAYDVLSNPQSRLIYDIMSLVYDKSSYPDIDVITPIKDNDDGVNVRAVNLQEVKSWICGYKTNKIFKVATFNNVLRINIITAVINWLSGWWHPKGFIANIKEIKYNFKHPYSKEESARVLIHNMVAFAKDGQKLQSAKCGLQAKKIMGSVNTTHIDEFLSKLDIKVQTPKPWNMAVCRFMQIVPALVLFLLLFMGFAGDHISLKDFINKKEKKIDYYQKVDFGARGQTVDDVVVGRVMSIPINKSDDTMLYHLTKDSKVMYGPSDDFDTIKTLSKNTTVRLTGKTPDDIWGRVMIDNGESGFVKFENLQQGIGNEIPFGSSIIE